jgi:TonB family protein
MNNSSLRIVIICLAVLLFSQRTGEATLSFAEEPTVVAAVAPVYGAIARTAHVGGEVTVEVLIDSDGKVKSVKGSGGHPLLLAAAKEASRQWLFAPAGSESIDRVATIIFVFKMMPRCAPAIDLTPIFHPPFKIEVRGETPPITCSDCSQAEQEKLRCTNQ